jgi:hypothetical protein
MSEVDRRELQAYLDRPLDDLLAELALYDPASRGPAEVWDKVAGAVWQRLCEEWDYCQRRQDARWENDLDLAAAVFVVLTTRVLHLPIEADLPLIAVIVVKRGLDAFCGCP